MILRCYLSDFRKLVEDEDTMDTEAEVFASASSQTIVGLGGMT
jgi:hypothetical protein